MVNSNRNSDHIKLRQAGRSSRSRFTRGVAIAELCVALPVLILFSAAVIDIGHVIHRRYNIVRASYEGVRYGMSLPLPEAGLTDTRGDQIRARIERLLDRRGLDVASIVITVNIDAAGGSGGISYGAQAADLITVRTSMPYTSPMNFLGTRNIVATTSSSSLMTS